MSSLDVSLQHFNANCFPVRSRDVALVRVWWTKSSRSWRKRSFYCDFVINEYRV